MWAVSGPVPEHAGSRDTIHLPRLANQTANNYSFSSYSSPHPSTLSSTTPSQQFGGPLPLSPPPPPPPPPSSLNASSDKDTILKIIDVLDQLPPPSVDGPPSAESIRAPIQEVVSRQRDGSVPSRDRLHNGHTPSSSSGSTSASMRSLASSVSDRPSWEHALETALNLSRRSSGRSSSSTMPSRERPDSVQLFGKTIFNRRTHRSRKDGGGSQSTTGSGHSGSSSGSSFSDFLGGAELILHPPPKHHHPASGPAGTIFSRRRVARETADTLSRRLQISEPYNFQHVLQLHKDSLPDFREHGLMPLVPDLASIRTHRRLDSNHPGSFSSEPHSAPAPVVPQRSSLRSLSSLPKRRTLKHSQSQEVIRSTCSSSSSSSMAPPPRPLRSPPSARSFSSTGTPPIPPPRTSSRLSTRRDIAASMEKALPERPQTSSSWRRRQSFSPADTPTPPASSHGYVPSPDMDVILESCLSPMAAAGESFAEWPLPYPPSSALTAEAREPALPPLPEQGEQQPSSVRLSGAPTLPALEQAMGEPILLALAFDENNNMTLSRPTSVAESLPPTPPPKDDVPLLPKLPIAEVVNQEHQTAAAPRRISVVTFVEPITSEQVNDEAPILDLAESEEEEENDDDDEDEEGAFSTGRRASVISISSLRGSISVPVLRPLSMRQEKKGRVSRYRCSAASDTLGRLDMFAAQRAIRASFDDTFATPIEESPCGNWEDDIDYCYEHEAEASCNYAWDRPSLDLSREDGDDGDDDSEAPFPDEEVTATLNLQRIRARTPSNDSTRMLTPVQHHHYDMPALSPSNSQVSSYTPHEASTPTGFVLPRLMRSPKSPQSPGSHSHIGSSNFSLPLLDSFLSRRLQQQPQPLHARNESDETSFKESQGFRLSPSLLIPSDFRQQMMAHEADFMAAAARDEVCPWEGQTLVMETSSLLVGRGRTSSSTMSSYPGSRGGSERAGSTASMSTDITRLTLSGFSSTTSLNTHSFEMDCNTNSSYGLPKAVDSPTTPATPSERTPSLHSEHSVHSRNESLCTMPTLPETEEPPVVPAVNGEHGLSGLGIRGKSDPNLVSLMGDEQPQQVCTLTRRKDSAPLRRPRARTTSLGNTPPPHCQYALFPRDTMTIPKTRI